MATNEELLRFAREARAGKLKKNPITASPNPPRFSNIGGKNRVVSGGLAPKIREKTKEEKEAVPKFITAGGLTNPTLVENPDYVPPVAPVAPPPASRFTGFGGQQNQIAENAFADASQFLKGGIPTPPMSPLDKGAEQNFTGVGDNEARLRSPQEQAQAIANAQNKALFTGGVTPQGISDTAGAIGARVAGGTGGGASPDALARMGIYSRAQTPAQVELADRNKGRFTGTVGSRERAAEGIRSASATERRAGEAQQLGLAKIAGEAGKIQGERDFTTKTAKDKAKAEQRSSIIKGLAENGAPPEEITLTQNQFKIEDAVEDHPALRGMNPDQLRQRKQSIQNALKLGKGKLTKAEEKNLKKQFESIELIIDLTPAQEIEEPSFWDKFK